MLLTACGSGHPSTQSSATTTSSATSTPLVACASGQIGGQLRSIQGAAGNWAAAFWFDDKSRTSCLLASPIEVQLLSSTGVAQIQTTGSFSPVALTETTPLPPPGTNLLSGELGYVGLLWPTDADAALQMGSSSGKCPMPDFIPTTVRMIFGNGASIDIPNHSVSSNGPSSMEICGGSISVQPVEAVTPP